ncbi:GntP family permease [Ignatzschineria rhizosphaerae]|uniref:GntP family permease n=1 Tax=Ignatzschineria rhizosphaerae TaxID=2923279 RepID=A0ABY3X3I7_9GAMM|nr:GntP family permease [Ignatzschineria rhizosphaerae]UNM96259.1 GntP family permease [Ignatzschineria rhizosphaerae]
MDDSSMLLNAFFVIASILAIILLTSRWKFNVFASLFSVSFVLALLTIPMPKVIDLLKVSFGNTMGGIAFVIIFGTVIAICMEKSGAVRSIASHILNFTGKRRAKQATALTGFIPGLTIFCDTGFIILSGIAKNFSAQSKTAMPLMAAILGCSLYAAHCLIPTHPGALGAAVELDANIGYLVVFGILFAIPGAIAAYFWATLMSKGQNFEPAKEETTIVSEDLTKLPSFKASLLPILLPLLLISISTLFSALGLKTGSVAEIIHFLGNPVIALLIGAIIGLTLFKKKGKESLSEVIEEAIGKAGPILIITASGGMFGSIIRETGVGGALGELLSGASVSLLVPFILAALLKTAQGSSTVAALTTAGIVTPILTHLGLDSEMGRVFTVLALGAGSAVVSHANDSYFWVVTKFSDIEVDQSLRVFTTSTFVMGVVMFICIWVTSLFIL